MRRYIIRNIKAIGFVLASIYDTLWLILCAALVFLMQPGFVCLESGLVRSKNSINVAMKNMLDVCIAGLLFWAVGYGIMFGDSQFGLWGASHFFFGDTALAAGDPAYQYSIFLFQLTFCATAVTLISGATAERMHLSAYLWIAVLTATLIYPVVGHWSWAGVLAGTQEGWLNKLGFVDYAGATVVHSVGGWIALAAIIIIGPRHLRFEHKQFSHSHNIPLALLGTLLLWLGWFGFNGGSLLQWNVSVPKILINTGLAAMAGGMVMYFLSQYVKGFVDPELMIMGVLAGLVSITACCHIISPWEAVLIGGIGSSLCFLTAQLLERFHIDDAVGVVPVHLAGGIWSTIAVALFGDTLLGSASMLSQLGVQLLGVVSVAAWAFSISFIALTLLNRIRPMRVPLEQEIQGLNMAEHHASTEVFDLLRDMEQQRQTGDFTQSIHVEPHTDIGQVAKQYNRVIERVNQATERAHQARDEAIQANQVKTEFMANVSHELRTPMNAVLGMVQLLRHTALTTEQRNQVDVIYQSGTSLLEMINHILEFSKTESDNVVLEQKPFSLEQVVEHVVELLTPLAEEKNLILMDEFDASIPNDLLGDGMRLQQVLINLVDNGVKFTRQGYVKLCVKLIDNEKDKARIQFRIRDTGIGISEAKQKELFEAFSQLDSSSTRDYGGVGLGLALSQQYVRLMGGEINISSQPDKGTDVYFDLRLPVVIEETTQTNTTPQFAKLNLKILVVEDNIVNQQIVVAMLESFHCQIYIANDGVEALQQLERQSVDIVLMDCQMPNMDGYEATLEIRKSTVYGKVPVIALTANTLDSDRERCKQVGMDDFLAKPVGQVELYQCLKRWYTEIKAAS